MFEIDTKDIIIKVENLKRNSDSYATELTKNNELSNQVKNLQTQLQNLRTAFDLQTKADENTGAELLAVSHERDTFKSIVEGTSNALQCDRTLFSILIAIDSLKTASDDIAKEYAVLKTAFEASAIFKRIPKKTLTIWEKIKNIFQGR